MTAHDLHFLLDSVPDTREVVLRPSVREDDPLAAWRVAADDVRGAYAAWCREPGRVRHAAYLAAVDQADAALAPLAGG